MPICPECKAEYVEGIEVCADCGLTLVEELSEESQSDEKKDDGYDEQAAFLRLAQELADAEEGKEPDEKLREVVEREMAARMRSERVPLYRDSQERAEEHRSSAYTLISIGVIGIALMILFFFDVLPFTMAGFSKYMITGVMGALFVLFLIMGIVSLRSFRSLEGKARKESNLTEEIKNWCKQNLAADALDRELFSDDEEESLGEEVKYFRRFELLKERLGQQFVNLDEGYLDSLIDDIYPTLWEE